MWPRMEWSGAALPQRIAALRVGSFLRAVRSELAEQDQDQEDNHHEAEPSAPVVPGPIEGAATDTTEAAQQDDDQYDQQDRSKRHDYLLCFRNEVGMHLDEITSN